MLQANYFNYFTEIEDHFQRARGTSLFLLSPLDWALIESWKNSGVPLEAVLRGIDTAFDKWRAKRSRAQLVNSLAFCAQAVMTEAQRMADTASPKPERSSEPPFPEADLRGYLESNAAAIRATNINELGPIAHAVDQIAAELPAVALDLESLELRLTVLEQKLIAVVRAKQTEEQALAFRKALEDYLRPYRGRMTAPQIAMLESQFLDRAALEAAAIPRLSLFYLR